MFYHKNAFLLRLALLSLNRRLGSGNVAHRQDGFLSSSWGDTYALTKDKRQGKKRNHWIITYIFIVIS